MRGLVGGLDKPATLCFQMHEDSASHASATRPAEVLANLPEQPEAIAYQCARRRWVEFHATLDGATLEPCPRDRETSIPGGVVTVLRALPACERVPVAFGVFLSVAQQWTSAAQASFRREFLPEPSPIEERILDAAGRGALQLPEKLPVTLEEVPSRIWQRAQESRSPERLVHAAALAVRRIKCLLYQNGMCQADDIVRFLNPAGVPDVIDLIVYPPSELHELKTQVLNKLQEAVMAHGLWLDAEKGKASLAWIELHTPETTRHAEAMVDDAREKMEAIAGLAKPKVSAQFELHRLGRLLFRAGLRGEALRCAKALGVSPWERGWQFQAIAGHTHTRIRRLLVKPDRDSAAWQREPALACSAMSRPLWLIDGISRVPALVNLFNQAHDCPWIYPRLHQVFQWHLALAGKHEALREVEAMDADGAVGLGGHA